MRQYLRHLLERALHPAGQVLTAKQAPLVTRLLLDLEIAAEMFLSRNTVKSEANSICGKLGASSRSQAVSRSRDLGLLDAWGAASPFHSWDDAIPPRLVRSLP
jgi:LuxR family transcriptional regulator, maltose regulon positive regulatory protein